MTTKLNERKSQNQNKQVARIVKSMLDQNIETKQYLYTQAPAAVFSGAGSLLYPLFVGLAQGAGNGQRVGDKIEMKSLDIKLSIYNGIGATANLFTSHRVIIFQYFGSTLVTAPNPALMLAASTLNVGGVIGALSEYLEEYRHLFRVLHDAVFTTNGTQALAALGDAGVGHYVTHAASVSLKRCQRKIQFDSALTTGNNMLFALITTAQATIATNPVVGFSSSAIYTDA